MTKVILEARQVAKKLNRKLILDNISLRCERNMIIAIQGKNGSGKSTLLKLLAGIYEPTSGQMIRRTRKIGYVPEHFPEKLRFKVKDYLMLIGSIHNIDKQQLEAKLIKYFQLFNIEAYLQTPLKLCSKGTKQKVGIIQALLHDPDILLLDEPLTGLDATSQDELILILEKLKRERTILFTTHEEMMVDRLADQIFYVDSGKLLTLNRSRRKLMQIKIECDHSERLKEVDVAFHIRSVGPETILTVDGEKSDQLLLELLQNNFSVREVKEVNEC